jgi:hypothetical protein
MNVLGLIWELEARCCNEYGMSGMCNVSEREKENYKEMEEGETGI